MTLYQRDNSDVERVRDASDIVRVVGEAVALKPKGREFVGLCPFHDDHKPSMNVVPSKQIFHCFVCQAGGDVFSFVQKYYKMDFREALEHLAEKFNIQLMPRRASAAPADGADAGPTRSDLVRACQTANDFYRAILRTDHGAAARAILDRRGISPEMQDLFQLGASPARWDGLLLTLRGKQLPQEAFIQAGLLRRRESGAGAGECIDYFRNRLMFPIHDLSGRPIAFGARKIDEADEPKYLNSPDTRIFKKSGTFYGLFQASKTLRRDRTAIITEGYTDTIALHQAGFTNAVAALGTAFNREHAKELRRHCDTVILLFDGDDAGQRAADRSFDALFSDVFIAEALDVKIIALNAFTDAKDPDELLKRPDGSAVFAQALDQAADLIDFHFNRFRASITDKGVAGQSRALEDEVARLASLGLREAPLHRQRLIARKLAHTVGLDEQTVTDMIPAGRKPFSPAAGGGAAPSFPAPRAFSHTPSATADHLVGCILCDGSLWFSLDARGQDFLGRAAYGSALLAVIARAMGDVARSGNTPDLRAVLDTLHDHDEDDSVVQAAVSLQQHLDQITGQGARLSAYWNSCLVACDLATPRGPAATVEVTTRPGGSTTPAPKGIWSTLHKQGKFDNAVSLPERGAEPRPVSKSE